MKSITLFLFTLLPQLSMAQIGVIIGPSEGITTEKSARPSVETSLLTILDEITNGHKSDIEKSKAIFEWITTHISYDNELHYNRSLQQRIYTSKEHVIHHVLKRKKALCGGFALMYQSLCNLAGIKSNVVHGYTKKDGQFNTEAGVHHSWNLVYLNKKWYPLDITWAISHGKKGQPNMFWYLTSSNDFYLSHLPE